LIKPLTTTLINILLGESLGFHITMRSMSKNQLYFGDNLDVLNRYIENESVDLIYLDPPFNSHQDYNVLFREKDGTSSASQITAFEDTWEWNAESKRVYETLVERGDSVSDVMRAFHTFLSGSDMMAYLAMMAPRLLELHRVLALTGSIYLHCDPTASHYLKLLMDGIFGASNFRNDIIWKRADTVKGNFGQGARFFDRNTDSILFYSKSDEQFFEPQFRPYTAEYLEQFYKYKEPDGRRYQLISMTGPGGAAKGNPYYEVMGVSRYWRYSPESMIKLIEQGMVVQTSPGAVPRRKLYLDKGKGVAVQSLWDDIPALHSLAAERLGYPTQKPEALLERIIKASSKEGQVVLDPFCGCGTSIVAAEKLNRRWIGIDVTHLAIGLIKQRLQDAFGSQIKEQYEVMGEPTDFSSAKVLAEQDRFQFQAWALGLVGARRAASSRKGADHGIDGKLFFRDGKGDHRQIILSVKSGGVQVRDVRDLVGTIDREKADMGVLITLDEPSRPMLKEAVDAGFFKSPNFSDPVQRIQILTIEELLGGKQIQFPHIQVETFKQAPKSKAKAAENLTFDLE
jgi:DNA modification methylase